MDERDAKRLILECSRRYKIGETLEIRQLDNGDWLGTPQGVEITGVVLKGGNAIPFFGALGKLVPTLGLPTSHERLLGSTRRGRYQVYDGGLAVWEDIEEIGDIGFPIAKWVSSANRARTCNALIAFFDLRGFTKWSGSLQDPNEIQRVVEDMENAFQESFSDCPKLFVKSTGDGFMVVSEASWFGGEGNVIQPEHAKAFSQSCASTIRVAMKTIPGELAIGCGITTGQVTQLFLLGRIDYIGPQINEASKIQAVAYNELCIAEDVVELLNRANVKPEGWPLPGKGLRLKVESLNQAAASA